MSAFNGVIFDLDGTIINSASGIFSSAEYALKKMNVKVDYEKIKTFVGPSLYYSFHQTFGLNEQDALKAVDFYREDYFARGIYDCAVYDGVHETLTKLLSCGIKLSIASSKSVKGVEVALRYTGLDKYFQTISAPNPNDKGNDKQELIKKATLTDKSVMVGDRKFDVLGARENGIPTIFALYGFAPSGEVDECKPEYTINKFSEIIDIVL